MNEGASEFHSSTKMLVSSQDTITGLVDDIEHRLHKQIDLFYGVSVSLRYALRNAMDLVKIAECAQLSIYNRLSLTYDNETMVSVYGTGKSVYIVSLKELIDGLKERGIYAQYCTANMQLEKDGKNTVRASIAIARDKEILSQFIAEYNECVEKSVGIAGVEKGEWKELEELMK